MLLWIHYLKLKLSGRNNFISHAVVTLEEVLHQLHHTFDKLETGAGAFY